MWGPGQASALAGPGCPPALDPGRETLEPQVEVGWRVGRWERERTQYESVSGHLCPLKLQQLHSQPYYSMGFPVSFFSFSL